jgi:Uncharacterized protein encoded in toxicity protection region of plasmid R478, contains von Willebrand factor (vWF) domain
MSKQNIIEEPAKIVTTLETVEMNVAVGEGMRRLPVYLLLDTSGSMAGAPIQALRLGVEQFKKEVAEDPFAKESVYMGVITFGGEALYVTKGLVSFEDFVEDFPTNSLAADGQTPLGQALWLLIESLDKDVKSSVKGGEKGDWKPLVFILTDGEPTDEWRQPRQTILDRQTKKVINVITVGCGPRINEHNLKEIAIGPTFNMNNDNASFKRFFQWVSQSVRAASKAVSQTGGGEKPTNLPPPPDGIQYIP